MTTAGNADADVHDGELVEADDQNGFIDLRRLLVVVLEIETAIDRAHLEAEDLWLHERQRFAVDLDEAFAFLAVGDCGSYILSVQVHIDHFAFDS